MVIYEISTTIDHDFDCHLNVVLIISESWLHGFDSRLHGVLMCDPNRM